MDDGENLSPPEPGASGERLNPEGMAEPGDIGGERFTQLVKANDLLRRSLARLTNDGDLNVFLSHVLPEITQQVSASACHIFLFDAENQTLELRLSVQAGQICYRAQPGEPELFRSPFPADMTPAFNYLCEIRRIFSLNHGEFQRYVWPGTREWFCQAPVTQALGLALMMGDQPVGLLCMRFSHQLTLTPADTELIYALAHQTTLAIRLTHLTAMAKQAAVLKEQEQLAQGRLNQLTKLNQAVTQALDTLSMNPDLTQFTGHVLRVVAAQMEAPVTEFWSTSEDHAYLELACYRGVIRSKEDLRHDPRTQGVYIPAAIIGGESLTNRRLHYVIEDLPGSHTPCGNFSAGFNLQAWCQENGVSQMLNVPLNLGERTIGALVVYLSAERHFSKQHIELGYALAQQVTLSIQLTRLAETTKQGAIARERELAAQERLAELSRANEVLQASLSKLADDPDLERFLGHVLTVCTERFGAAEAGIWRYEGGLFRLFVSYEDGEIKQQSEVTHPGADLTIAKQIRNQEVLTRLRKREIISDYEEDFATRPVYEHFREYFRRRHIKTALKVPLFLDEDLRGILVLRFCNRHRFKPEEAELAFALGNQVVLALELTRLAEMAQAAAIMEERNRMAREIHDTLAQTFTSILMRLQTASLGLGELPDDWVAEVKADINRACDLAREGIASARHSVQALRPRSLHGRSLADALADALHQMTEGTALQSQFQLIGQPYHIEEATELELFRITQEAINNSCKHAQAHHLRVRLNFEPETLHLTIEDDGIGFTLTESTALKGFGLISMQQRAERIGARLMVSSRPGQGTQVCVVIEEGL